MVRQRTKERRSVKQSVLRMEPIHCEHIVASNGGPIPTEMIHYYVKEASMFIILALRMRDARIAPGAAAVLAKEPGQIRWTILRIATKIIDVVPAEIAEEQRAALSIVALVVLSVPSYRIEGIELCAHRRDDAADPVRLASGLRV